MTNYSCEICGGPNARMKRYTSVVGLLVLNFRRETKVHIVCDDHKVKAGMPTLFANLILGWWGIFACIWNIIAIYTILNGGRDVTEEVELQYYLSQKKSN